MSNSSTRRASSSSASSSTPAASTAAAHWIGARSQARGALRSCPGLPLPPFTHVHIKTGGQASSSEYRLICFRISRSPSSCCGNVS